MAPDSRDGRVKVLKPTAAGLKLFADAMEVYDEVEREFAEQIGSRGLKQLRMLLRKLCGANLGSRR